MILRDSCFILELLCLFAEKKYHDQDDYILRTTWMRNGIKLDLVLFENQLPFSFLEKLYAFAEPRHEIENLLGSSQVQTIPYPDSEEGGSINSCIHFIKGILSFKFCHCVRGPKNPNEDINSSTSRNSTDNDDHTLLKITYNFFANLCPGIGAGKEFDRKEIKHFTDLFRHF
ncbi:uncharacterized protein LOC133790136 [Humulus lupulus]|uniref:uncharacterized protein LOC133790136 n=1 Tax=Humulus lupulus TaxID=3486 RepID=UPI002B40973F|nr:uncharacterized protein LOC133790136 [Humulus lupulus]